ncbi:MAG: hypothetical protein DRJ40_01585 [Thermoprotei archaeon]|nr:MAG: hypothetical protein DRJ40_01585 [Thermoprotei archaeon]
MSQTQQAGILSVILLVLSSFLAGVGFGIYAPLIPIQATELGAPEAIATATVLALPSILAVLVMLPMGILADKTGRRKEIVMIGLLLGAVFNALLGIATSWVELAIYRAFTGITFALISIFLSIAVLIAPERLRGTVIAIMGGTMMLGMGISQMFAGAVFTALGRSYRALYFLAAAVALAAAIILLPVKVPRVQLPAMKGSDILEALKARGVYWAGMAILVYLVGWNLMYPSLPIVLTYIYKAPPEISSLALGVASLMLGLGTYIWGPIIDKLGGRRTLILAILASAITTFVMYPALGNMWAYIVLFWIVTFFGVVGAPGTSYVASRSVKPELISIALSTIWIFTSLAGIIGGFVAGASIASLGLATTILIAAAIELVGGILMFGLPKV